MNKDMVLKKVDILFKMYNEGKLGGEVMPEDANPHLEKSANENYLYFTLPMALNYQRNSYTLWQNALKTYNDNETNFVFNPKLCLQKSFEEVQYALTKYKVVLQKQKQTEIWLSLCKTFAELFDGDIRKLFGMLDNDVDKIRTFIQKENKKKFPYLSGTKICNYWMYVIYKYTDRKYKNIENLTVAPDTHVCKATHKLGLINDDEFNSNSVQQIVIDRWQELFKNTKYKCIDIHTPLWLWSRNGFKELDDKNVLERVIDTCYFVYENSKYVQIDKDIIKDFIKNNDFDKTNHWLSSNPFGILDLDVKDIVNFLVIFDSVDCSFWGNPKWTIKTQKGEIDGSFALMYCLLELMKKKKHLNFEKISFEEFSTSLKGNVIIPLLKERYNVVVRLSKIINSKMNGNFYEYIKNITNDLELFNVIINNFPSFNDCRIYDNKKIYFYKLAQLLTSDILHIRKLKENIEINCSNLVGCADYKIPQVLRGLGILKYDEKLSNIVDKKYEIKENSIYEIEIRACMIVAIDMIKKELNNKLCSIDINDIIWSFSQNNQVSFKPYHLTRTMSY